MKLKFLSMAAGALALGLASTADAQVSLTFGINSCGYPGVYQRCTDYPPPPTVYLGAGHWGDDDRRGDRYDDRRGRRDRDHHDRDHHDRGHDNRGHDGDGDRRH